MMSHKKVLFLGDLVGTVKPTRSLVLSYSVDGDHCLQLRETPLVNMLFKNVCPCIARNPVIDLINRNRFLMSNLVKIIDFSSSVQ